MGNSEFDPAIIPDEIWKNHDDIADTEIAACRHANQFLQQGEFSKALESFLPLIGEGNATAMCDIGLLYLRGLLGETDISQAIYYLEKSASMGATLPLYILSNIYRSKESGFYNPAKGIKFLRIASDHSHAPSMVALGMAFYSGDGVKQSIPDAIKWWSFAAQNECPEAFYKLGRLYSDGLHIEQDYKVAVSIFERGALLGNSDCQVALGQMYQGGLGVEENLDQSFTLYRLSSLQGNPVGHYYLAASYEYGRGVESDYQEAYKLYSLAAEAKYPEAITSLGSMIGRGLVGVADRETSAKMYIEAAGLGDLMAQYNIGIRLLNGDGIDQDINAGIQYLETAARHGNPDSIEALQYLDEKFGYKSDAIPTAQ